MVFITPIVLLAGRFSASLRLRFDLTLQRGSSSVARAHVTKVIITGGAVFAKHPGVCEACRVPLQALSPAWQSPVILNILPQDKACPHLKPVPVTAKLECPLATTLSTCAVPVDSGLLAT